MKIEVGMWIRTKLGRICQVNKINDVRYVRCPRTREQFDKFYAGRSRTVINGRYELEDIVKISNSILGDADNPCLIEIGDYVNGYKVIQIGLEGDGEHIHTYLELDMNNDIHWIEDIIENSEQIKSIVSKEQFRKIEYELGD